MSEETNWEFYVDRFEKKSLRGTNGLELPYRFLKPLKIEAGKKYPVVLFFHGAGERGAENTRQLLNGAFEFAKDSIRSKYPCFLIAPQCPLERKWTDTDWGALSHSMKPEETPELKTALEILDSVLREFPVDVNRVYVSGISMGGYGTWDTIQRYAERFAAAVPVCGGGDPAYAKRLVKLPIWTFHGDADDAVKVSRSRDMVEAIRKAGGQIEYTEYPGVGHNSWAETYANPALYEWLFAQVKK